MNKKKAEKNKIYQQILELSEKTKNIIIVENVLKELIKLYPEIK